MGDRNVAELGRRKVACSPRSTITSRLAPTAVQTELAAAMSFDKAEFQSVAEVASFSACRNCDVAAVCRLNSAALLSARQERTTAIKRCVGSLA